MSISIGQDSILSLTSQAASNKARTSKLENALTAGTGDLEDEQLMDVCKEFEAYLVEQVYKGMRNTVPQSEEKNDYLAQFEDILYEQYAKDTTETGSLGIAQMLYESMKRS